MSWLSERLSALAARLDYVRLKHITYNAGLITGSRNVSFLGKKRFTDAYRYRDVFRSYVRRKAIEYFWPKLSTGAMVVLDDYGWTGYEAQKEAIDEFTGSVGIEALTLPTGQGLLVKP